MMNPKYEKRSGENDAILRPRKISPQNIVIRLKQRETSCSARPGMQGHFHICRSFYQNIVPNFTVVNVEKPPCFLRKFSPDGKHFIAFSLDQTSLEVYEYRGPSAAEDLLQNESGEFVGNDVNEAGELKRKIFNRFFRLKYSIVIAPSGEQLNRECRYDLFIITQIFQTFL